MLGLALFVIIGLAAITGTTAQHGLSKMCYDCHNVVDPSHCHTRMKCPGEEACRTEVHFMHGEYLYTLGCGEHHDCEHNLGPIGKRRPHEHGDVVCRECCFHDSCNNQQCSKYLPTAAPAVTTTAPMMTTAAPVGTCRDHEEDGFACSYYDQFNFCTDTSGFAHTIAHDKCPQHCGFCDANGHYVGQSNQQATDAPSITEKATADPLATANPMTEDTTTVAMTTGGWSPQGVSIDVTHGSQVTATSDPPCVDYEDQTFSCADWASHGFCTMTTGQGHEIAKLRCRQYCGYCQTTF